MADAQQMIIVRSAVRRSAATTSESAAQNQGELRLRRIADVGAQVALLWFMSWLGHETVVLLHLPLPGNVAGLLLTFLALSCGILPVRLIEQGTGLLLGNLPLFFVPLAVGFVTYSDLFAAHGFAIVATLVGSAAVGFFATGRVAQLVTRLQGSATIAMKGRHAEPRLDRR